MPMAVSRERGKSLLDGPEETQGHDCRKKNERFGGKVYGLTRQIKATEIYDNPIFEEERVSARSTARKRKPTGTNC